MSRCGARARFIEVADGADVVARTRCVLDAGHNGKHVGERAVSPLPTWDREGQVVDLRLPSAAERLRRLAATPPKVEPRVLRSRPSSVYEAHMEREG